MSLSTGEELMTGLSDIPVFTASLAVVCAAFRRRKDGRIGRNWFWLSVWLAAASLAGVVFHVFDFKERVMRVAWPFEFLIITELSALIWIQIVGIVSPESMGERTRKAITVYSLIVSAVNGVRRYMTGADMSPIFCAVAIPAVIHIAVSVFRDRSEERRGIRRCLTAIAVLLPLAVVTEAFMTKPVTVFGLELGGAFFSHIMLIITMIFLIGVIRYGSGTADTDE